MSLEVDIEKKLNNIRLKVKFQTSENGAVTGILGASGCGKSMTLKCIAGIETPDRGRIVLNGRVLFDSEKKINVRVQDRRTGYLFQSYALFPNMTVRQNIEIAIPDRHPAKSKQILTKKYLDLFRVPELEYNYPAALSGGQQQRVALARIFASNPDVLMLDEPFSAMDSYLKEKLQIELLELLKNYEGDILMVTHDRDEVYRFCSQIHVLEDGKQVVSGETKEVFSNPQTVAAARLTGCKNIAAVQMISEDRWYVSDWDTELVFQKLVPKDTGYIGIRAHHFKKVEPGKKETVILCKMKRMLEEPFEFTVIMENGIWWKVSKERLNTEFHGILPKELSIPEECVLFLKR